jgi:hypothetical protein
MRHGDCDTVRPRGRALPLFANPDCARIGIVSGMIGVDGGEFYAVSLDFNHAQLQQILAKADPGIAAFVRAKIANDPASPRSIDLNGHVVFSVRARLGQLQSAPKGQFVPPLAQEIL